MAADLLTYAYAADITKTERDENGNLLVYGKATGSDRDLDGQRCDPEWLKTAMPAWFEWANIREMHQPIAAGVGIELTNDGDDWYIKSKVVDPNTARKIEAGALKGYSIGVSKPVIRKHGGEEWIAGGDICETSYVDRPCLPTAKMMICKLAGSELQPVEAADAETKTTPTPKDFAKLLNKTATPDRSARAVDDALVGLVRDHLNKRKFTVEDREQAAADGNALDDGSFPIESVTDLRNAIRRIGSGKDPRKARAHIKRRAKALGRTDLIPDAWKTSDPDLTKDADAEQVHDPSTLADIRDGLADLIRCELDELCDGEFELYDIEQLLTTLRMFMSYWSSEAGMGETESPYALKTQEPDMTTTAVVDETQTPAPSANAVLGSSETKPGPATVTGESPPETPAADATAPNSEPPAGDTADKATIPDPNPTNLGELVKSAIADALRPAEERMKALEADLAKALALPEPGGPVITRTAAQAAAARNNDQLVLKAQIAELLTKADRYHDQDRFLAQGYRDRAAQLTAQLT